MSFTYQPTQNMDPKSFEHGFLTASTRLIYRKHSVGYIDNQDPVVSAKMIATFAALKEYTYPGSPAAPSLRADVFKLLVTWEDGFSIFKERLLAALDATHSDNTLRAFLEKANFSTCPESKIEELRNSVMEFGVAIQALQRVASAQAHVDKPQPGSK